MNSDITLYHRYDSLSCGITFQKDVLYFLIAEKDVNGNFWTDQHLNMQLHPSAVISYLEHGKDVIVPSRKACNLLEEITSNQLREKVKNQHGINRKICEFYDTDNAIRLYRAWENYKTQQGLDLVMWH